MKRRNTPSELPQRWIKPTELQNKKAAGSGKKELGNQIVSDFEAHMNDNLDVKVAFDGMYETIKKISEKQEALQDVDTVLAGLRRVDSVLQCIF